MVSCIACGISHKKRNEITSFHRFPKNEAQRRMWVNFVGKTEIKKFSYLCSNHFTEEDFDMSSSKSKLKPGAIPSKIIVRQRYIRSIRSKMNKSGKRRSGHIYAVKNSLDHTYCAFTVKEKFEHDKHLIKGPNKCENTTNMQENETSDKENTSISITKEQLEQRCRTCFIRNGTINVFTKHHGGILFCDLLKKLSLAEIHQLDGLPQKICGYCSSFIINVFAFKKEIVKSFIKLKAARRQLDNQNIPESQCDGSGKSKVSSNIHKVVENFKIQVYVEDEEDNESKNEIIQQIVVAPNQDNNKNKNINKDSESTRSVLKDSHFDGPNADSGSHNNFRSLLNNVGNIRRKYLRTRKLLMSQILKRINTSTSVLLDHNYIKSVDRKNCITNKKRGKEKKKVKLCPCSKKGQKFRINKFLNRQICFDKYSHCDKYTCTYCQSKNSLWLKHGAHNRGKHRNKHFYT
ncbi:unnamed protein product [Diabrotica balteata]|uniref:Uncharacterized protein n=1 Tax=Diabrotica balteata TaxID=107213 RepID=A0A9P0H003_DIABA|nr:unnamed protein product [Diabrotica balteata]